MQGLYLALQQALLLVVHFLPIVTIVVGKKSHDDNLSPLPTPYDLRVSDNLEKIVPAFASFPGRMYAGSLPMDHYSTSTRGANKDNKRTGFLQFWLFVPNEVAATNTMVSWFNGGPGCSSFSAGVMFEHSPVTVPLNEAGWCCEKEDEPLQYNQHAWTNATVMLYVEQPIGVGFSEATHNTPPPSSEDDVAADFDAFLQNFYKVFDGFEFSNNNSHNNKHKKDQDDKDMYDPTLDMRNHKLYLVGESYAGIYIPSVARGIYLNNVVNLPNIDHSQRFTVPLAGMAIGNGKMDAITQDPAVIDFAYWHGLIDGPTRDYLFAEWNHCMDNLKAGEGSFVLEPEPFHSFTVRDDCGVLDAVMNAAGAGAFEKFLNGPNIYEYSTWDEYAAADGENGTVTKFYNNIDVQKALNVPIHRQSPHHQWAGCIPELAPSEDDNNNNNNRERRLSSFESSPTPRIRGSEETMLPILSSNNTAKSATSIMNHRRRLFMDNDTPWSVIPYVAQLLDEAKINVLIYSGDRDIICCTQGSEEALRKMDWSGTREAAASTPDKQVHPKRNAWTEAPRGLWIYNDYPAGYTKSYKNLNLLTIYNAGHMVPYNQPGPALDMLTRFLKGESFHDRPLVSYADRLMPTRREEHVVAARAESHTRQHDEFYQMNNEDSLMEKSTLYNNETTPAMTTSNSMLFSMLLLVTLVAFGLGFLVARTTASPPESPTMTMEEQPLKDDYGSVSPHELLHFVEGREHLKTIREES